MRRDLNEPHRAAGRRPRWVTVGAANLLLAMPLAARAADPPLPPPPPLPALDLGQTNVLDGEGGPGRLLESIGAATVADHLAQDNGNSAPGRNHQHIVAFVLHPIFVSAPSFLGAHPGVELLVPFSRVDNDFAAGGSGRHSGLGDINVTPFLQWSKRDPGDGDVSARLGFQVVAPSGDHSSDRSVNTGLGAWQLSPYLAFTWRTTERWEVSGRAIYDWSGVAGSRVPGGPETGLRAGDVFALNLSTSYAVSDALRLGVGGYALRQLHDSDVAGVHVDGSRQRVSAVGPVMRWTVGGFHVFGAAFGEFGARNRPAGATLNIRLQHLF